MATKYYIPAGFVHSNAPAAGGNALAAPNTPLSKGRFDLHRWLRNELAFLGVANTDPCCTTGQTIFPLRYNSTSSHMERQQADGTWVAIAGF